MIDFSKLKYIDCHSHPHDDKYVRENIDIDKLLKDLHNDGGATIAIGTDYDNTKRAIDLSLKHDNLWSTIGIHPADNHAEVFDLDKFEEFYKLGGEKIVGIGECGLDYYYFDKTYSELDPEERESKIEIEKERQRELFINQIEFAISKKLPLIIHGRPNKNSMDAYRDILDILEEYKNDNLNGHAHFFVGNLEIAKRFLNLGFLLSFDGPITFTTEYDEVIKFVPIDKIMIETDSPYAAPASHRGQINYPIYVKDVAGKIAALKALELEEVLEITKNNAINLFNLKQ